MDIFFTVIAWSEVVMIANDACQLLNETVSPLFSEEDFGGGIQIVTIVAVAVSDDDTVNRRFYEAHTKNGFSKNPSTAEKRKSISIGVPIEMESLHNNNIFKIADIIVAGLEARLPLIKYPKKFDRHRFEEKLLSNCKNFTSLM